MKFSIKDFFSKCDQIRRKLWIWLHLLEKSLKENFIFCAVKEIKRGDYQCKFYNHIDCTKWYENKSVMLPGSHVEEITSILTVQTGLKGSSSKIPVNCTIGIKLYNSKMGGVDLMGQLKSAYQFD